MKPEPFHMSSVVTRVLRLSSVVLLPAAFGACSWFTDFKTQPSVKPWEPLSQLASDTTTPPRGNPEGSVPVQGVTVTSWQIGYDRLPAVIDSFSPIPNPHLATEASVENGRKHYQINCAVCHGMAGDGNGGLKQVSPAYAFSPSLLTPLALGRSDGYLYGVIRNGRGMMPSYNRIEDPDRWDVVNYLRALQGKSTIKADTTHLGYPGQNGTTVPRASATAPTRPAPFARPTQTPTPGSPNINSATFKGNNEFDTMRKLHGSHDAKAAAGEGKEKHE